MSVAVLPSDTQPGRGLASDSALERSRGAARLRFGVRHGRSRLLERYASSPLRIMTPAASEVPEAVLANTSGGIAGGDALEWRIAVGEGAEALVSGQAAERIYQAIDSPARIETDLSIAEGGVLEWLPQETILFDGSQLRRQIRVTLAEDARLLMAEMTVLGREAYAERFDSGYFLDQWQIDRAGAPVWRERLRTEGGSAALAAETGFRGRRALATVIYAGPNAAALLEPVRDLLAGSSHFAGATVVRGLLVVRVLGLEAGLLKRDLGEFIGAFRALALDRPACAPRVWLC